MRKIAFLVACKAESMEGRSAFTRWLKERDAIHVLGDVWLLNATYDFAGDIERDFERFPDFDGKLVAIRLSRAAKWAERNLSEEAKSWLCENIGS
jgi:hypothetical protein